MQCRACAHDIPDASRFCPLCGAALSASQVETRREARPGPQTPATNPIDNARFIPGTIFASRYRIVSLVGRGGMGEVYRADDLKLGERVAVKFLPERFAFDPDRLARFHREASVARQVSHPNVCRVHDIAEADGVHFLSMEYVDGEDLASLLRRIGRLPSDKAIQVARQLCAGLAAAHERGVMHRDLKPRNVLLDADGRVRIADFGLAALIDDQREARSIAGTPAYMAPEQRDGRGASVRSDVYALGLILYEIFTGKPAFDAIVVRHGGRRQALGPPVSPSDLVGDLDPKVEQVILRCLEYEPGDRPASALAVAAALPGGDPLAAALAAGETPSPEMVAAAGERGAISPAIGLASVMLIVAGIAGIARTSHLTTLVAVAGIDKEPVALAERARTVARGLGYADRPLDEAYGYQSDFTALQYLADQDRSAGRWQALRQGRPAGVAFWYRQSPRPLASLTFTFAGPGQVSYTDPPASAGMLSMRLDPAGRLLQFLAVPMSTRPGSASAPSYDWSRFFVEAGLSMSDFSSVEPTSAPPVFADTRKAWTGVFPGSRAVPIRVEAAAAAGQLVAFDVLTPWSQSTSAESGQRAPLPATTTSVITLLLLACGGLLIRRALRQRRSDRRGAFRFAVFMFIASVGSDAVGAHHPGDLGLELNLLLMLLSLAVFRAAAAWLLYVVVESQIRRVWPETMIGWSRLLAGRVRDPLVGRDIVFGLCAGVLLIWTVALATLAPRWFGAAGPLVGAGRDFNLSPGFLPIGARQGLYVLVMDVAIATFAATGFAVLLVFCKSLIPSRIAAALALALLLLTIFTAQVAAKTPSLSAGQMLFPAIAATIHVTVLVRFGLLASAAATATSMLASNVPITLNWSAPYAESSYLTIAALVGSAVYGLHSALGGRPIFDTESVNQPAVRA